MSSEARSPVPDDFYRNTSDETAPEQRGERPLLEERLLAAQRFAVVSRHVAHNFNNQLMIIASYAEMMKDELGIDDPKRENVERVLEASKRAASLTKKLFECTPPPPGSAKLLPINDFVSGMADTLKRHLGAQIELSIIVDQVSGWIEADPLQLEQAILNVATNSREAMPNGGNFSIVVSRVNSEGDRCLPSHVRGGRYVMVSLRDDGPGMDRKTLSRLFEVFFSTKDSKTNTGIGLAMVRSLLKQRGGDVEVSSELGKGTTVNLILPELACLDDVPNPAQKSFH